MKFKKLKVKRLLTMKKLRDKWGLTGSKLKKRLGLAQANSARSVTLRGDSIYGPTGSIVGRF